MKQHRQFATRPTQLSYAVSLALASLVASNAALAQEAPPASAPAATDAVTQVLVVGTRRSQQSSIERKKNSATAMDSIVAEDVGAFPDRNVGEAISRIAGVALDRGDFGEGVNVTVRGNSPDLTRVEIDGQGVQAGGGSGLDPNSQTAGRGVELRELSADLIKSVDIVKGSTADMTEGSLGGGIIIKTRTGLDFKKPFFAVRIAASQGSLNKQWSPDLNLIWTSKFLDNRLGVLFNANKSTVHNESHGITNWANSSGYFRPVDFDNSPEKTYALLPDTVSKTDPTALAPVQHFLLTDGSGKYFDSSSPYDIVAKSAAAKTKADCYAQFPAIPVDTLNKLTAGNTARNPALAQRTAEQITCLSQWNDHIPQVLRYAVRRQDDQRAAYDLRFDFKVNNELSLYAKLKRDNREIIGNSQTYALGDYIVNPASTNSPTYSGIAFSDNATTNVRTAATGSGYFIYDGLSYRSNAIGATGIAVNVDPASVKVDSKHHVTQFTVSDATANTDQIYNVIKTANEYLSFGGTFKRGGVSAEFLLGNARAEFSRGDQRTSFAVNYGPATLTVAPNGFWNYSAPPTSNFDQTNPALYSILRPAAANAAAVVASATNVKSIPAYSIAQLPRTSQAPGLSFSPQMRNTEETTAKLDLTYALRDNVPYITRLKGGFNFRNTGAEQWGAGGLTIKEALGTFGSAGYQPAIVLPTMNLRGNFIACENTPGSLGVGGAPCAYGYTTNNNINSVLFGQTVFTQAQFQDIIAQTLTQAPTAVFFGGAKNRSPNLINGWTGIDVPKVFALAGAPNVNFDCVQYCTASDGKVYAQPVSLFKEKTKAGYVMADFDIDHLPFSKMNLPFGMDLGGNFGYRYIETDVHATGSMTLTSIQINPATYNPLNPSAAGGIIVNKLRKNTSVDRRTVDFLPVYNLALWLVPDKLVARYNRAKTVARPPVNRLLPSGECSYDERVILTGDSEADQVCTGAVGNPELKAQENRNQNLSLEWYPNKDTMFSVGAFKYEGIVGPAITVGRSNVKLFSGTGLVDNQTGVALDNLDFTYNTYENGPPSTRKGIEYQSKTAFTFLPSVLKYTGLDINFTKLRSAVTEATIVDSYSGEALPVRGEPKYSYNISLWYDDGAFSARVAVQAVAENFTNLAANTSNVLNYYPTEGVTARGAPYNPGTGVWKDRTRYIDAKLGYKFKNGIDIFVEGRNLGLATTSNSQRNALFADGTPVVGDISYAGRRIMLGVNIKN